MAFRIFMIFAALVALYSGYNSWHLSSVKSGAHYAPEGFYSGPEKADVSVIEFLDYSCIRCQKTHPFLKAALSRHPDVRYVPKPVMSDNEGGIRAGKFVYAAGMQGKFMEAHEMMITLYSGGLNDTVLNNMIAALKLNGPKLKTDMERAEISRILSANLEQNFALGSPTVPTFFVNRDYLWVINNEIPSDQNFENLFKEVRSSL